MKDKTEGKRHDLRIILDESQYADLKKRLQSTTFRTIPEYIRALINQEPVVKRYRNQSLDEILEALVALKGELSDMALKLDEAVAKITTAPEIGPNLVNYLLAEQFSVKANLEHIKSLLLNIYNKCDQKE